MRRRDFLLGAIAVATASTMPAIAGVAVGSQHRYLIEPIDGVDRFHIRGAEERNGIGGKVMCGFASCWYGKVKPTVLISSPEYLIEYWGKLRPQSRFTMKYRGQECPYFNGAAWWDWEKGIKPNRIYMLNEEFPHDPKFNGWFDVERGVA